MTGVQTCALPICFKLPVLVDTTTLASGLTTRALGDDCRASASFRRKLENALNYLTMASSRDPQHLPTQVNLASACIIAGEYSKAMAAADAALKIAPGDPLAANAKAISLYLYGQSNNLDTADTALTLLREAASRHPELSDSLYNQATMVYERERDAAAKAAWQAFLAGEPQGPYAALARRYLGMTTEVPPQKSDGEAIQAPVALGVIRGETARLLKTATKRSFTIGRTDVALYETAGIRALAINGVIEIVETAQHPTADVTAFKRAHGEPQKTVTGTRETLLVYQTFAANLHDSLIRNIVFFRSKSE